MKPEIKEKLNKLRVSIPKNSQTPLSEIFRIGARVPMQPPSFFPQVSNSASYSTTLQQHRAGLVYSPPASKKP